MTNTFITPTQIAPYALPVLWDELRMLPLVSRDLQTAVQPGAGATVTYRKSPTLTANTFNQAVGVTAQNLTEASDTIVLNQHKEVTLKITSEQLTLDIDNFIARILRPALEPLAQAVDTSLLALRSDITHSVTASAYNASTNPHPSFDLVDARRILTSNKVPEAGRVCVVDEYIAAQWLRDQNFIRNDVRPTQGSAALADGALGRAYGFDNFETGHINDFTGVAFHPSAFQFVSAPLALPRGAAASEYMTYKDLTMRIVYSYDSTYLTDIMTMDILYGVKTTDANRAVLINGLADSV